MFYHCKLPYMVNSGFEAVTFNDSSDKIISITIFLISLHFNFHILLFFNWKIKNIIINNKKVLYFKIEIKDYDTHWKYKIIL